jgi:tetratricopeptide (TPR) repeat protein
LLAFSIAPAGAVSIAAGDAGDEAFGKAAYRAGSLFSRGQYADSELAWQRIVEAYPLRSLGWQNLATVELINTAGAMRLDELPATGAAAARLETAIAHFRRASTLAAASVDGLALNNEGNALGLLGRYDEALSTYRSAADASPRDFESIPRANAALTLLQLGRPDEGEKAAEAIVRRDPAFVDGFAIVAACRWARQDRIGAEDAYRRLCSEPTWCNLYASTDAVSGRWPPRAIETWSAFLAATRPAPPPGQY